MITGNYAPKRNREELKKNYSATWSAVRNAAYGLEEDRLKKWFNDLGHDLLQKDCLFYAIEDYQD